SPEFEAKVRTALGTNSGLTDQQVREIATVMLARKLDVNNPLHVATAADLFNKAAAVKAELGAKVTTLGALEVLRTKEEMKTANYTEAANLVVLRQIMGLKTNAEAKQLLDAKSISPQELNEMFDRISKQRLATDNVKSLMALDSDTRSMVMRYIVDKKETPTSTKYEFTNDQVQALLSLDKADIDKFLDDRARLNALKTVKEGSCTKEAAQLIARAPREELPGHVELISKMDGATQRAYAAAVRDGVISRADAEKISKFTETYKKHFDDLLKLGVVDKDVLKQFTDAQLLHDVAGAVVKRVQMGSLDADSARAVLKSDLATQKRIKEVLIEDTSRQKPALDAVAVKSLLDHKLSEKSIQTLYKALTSETISNRALTGIIQSPAREAYIRALWQKNLDARAVEHLLSARADARAVERYGQVIADARVREIPPDVLYDKTRAVEQALKEGKISKPQGADAAYEAQLALTLTLDEKNPHSEEDLKKAQERLASASKLEAEFGLSVREGLAVVDLRNKLGDFQLTSEDIDLARSIEQASRRLSNAQPVSTYDALFASLVLRQKRQEHNTENVKAALALQEGVARVNERQPSLSLAQCIQVADLQEKYTRLMGSRGEKIAPPTLTNPRDSDAVRIDLLDLAAKRVAAARDQVSNTTGKAQDLARLEQRSWDQIQRTLNDDRLGPALADAIMGHPDLAWQTALKLGADGLKELDNTRFIDVMKSATKKRLDTLDPAEKERLTRSLVAEAERRFAQGVPGESRSEFISQWIDVASSLPRDLTSLKTDHHFNILRTLNQNDLAQLKNDHLSKLISSLKEGRVQTLPKEEQASMLLGLLKEVSKENRQGIHDKSFDTILSRMDPSLVDLVPREELPWLKDKLRGELAASPNPESGLKTTAEYAAEIAAKLSGEPLSRATIDKLVADLSDKDRALALELLQERAQHLSEAGLQKQLKDLAQELRDKGFVNQVITSESRGRLTERVTVVCFEGSTNAMALAYELRKQTGLGVDLKVLKAGDKVPEGKVVLLDHISRAPEGLRAELEASPSVHKTASVLAFQNGVNFYDLAALESGPEGAQNARKKLAAMVAEAKAAGREPSKYADLKPAGTPLSDREFSELHSAVEKSRDHHLARTEAKTLMYFLDREKQKGSSAQLSAYVMDKSMEYISHKKMMDQARELRRQIYEPAGQPHPDPKKVFFIIEGDKADSNHLVSDIFRTANGMTAEEFNRQFITMEEARKMKAEGVTFVALDDAIYSGEQALKRMAKMEELVKSSGGKARVVTATLASCIEGFEVTERVGKEKGVEVLTAAKYQNAYQRAKAMIGEGALQRLLSGAQVPEGVNREEFVLRELLGDREWTARGSRAKEKISFGGVELPKVVSSLLFPHMRSNTTADNISRLADYVGLPKAYNESRARSLEEEAAKAGEGMSGLPQRQAQVRELLRHADAKILEEYRQSTEAIFNEFRDEIKTADDVRFVLGESVERLLANNKAFAESMDLDGRKIVVKATDDTSPKNHNEVEIRIDPKLLDPARLNEARAEVYRQLLLSRASVLDKDASAADLATLNKAIEKVVADKAFALEHPLVPLPKIEGIRNLTQVTDLFIVGGRPMQGKDTNIEALKALKERGVKTIINLRGQPTPKEEAWCRENGVEYRHIPLSTHNLTNEQIDAVLKLIEEQNKLGNKVFVHCENCRDRAPAIVAAWRMAKGLSYEEALSEMKQRFGHAETTPTASIRKVLPTRELGASPAGEGEAPGREGTPLADGKPAPERKPAYKKPGRGPAPTLDRIGGVDYQPNPDGTIVRRAEIVGKPLIGDEKTWRELLTKDEIEGLSRRRQELEKDAEEKRITEEGKKELAAIRELESKLHDPATHKQVIERLGAKRPAGGFKAGQAFGTLSGAAILTTAVLGWFIGTPQENRTPLRRAGIGG
ncbi:MAG TPA: dual specificity protein phosphatase, partial [Candidatus Obscuribacterales bacterium]